MEQQTRFYKYYILNTQTKDLKTEIIGCNNTLSDAIEAMNKYLDEHFVFNDYLKAFYVNNCTVCIYKYYYISSKELMNKICIIKFPIVVNVCDMCNLGD